MIATRGLAAVIVAMALLLCSGCYPPSWGANAILRPTRRPVLEAPSLPHEDVSFRTDDGLTLRGYLFRTTAPRRGLVVYLHGIADNCLSGVGAAQRLGPRGFDVLAYDGRGHGHSEGTYCTYGFYERNDVSRALDAVGASGAVLFGSSLGAAVALEAAAVDPRIVAVIAQSPFADLRSIVRDRAPFFASNSDIDEALALAGQWARFDPARVSAAAAAERITVPVLLLHGAVDVETPKAHSERIYARLTSDRRLMLVDGAGHNDVLAREDVWREILAFVEDSASQSKRTHQTAVGERPH